MQTIMLENKVTKKALSLPLRGLQSSGEDNVCPWKLLRGWFLAKFHMIDVMKQNQSSSSSKIKCSTISYLKKIIKYANSQGTVFLLLN